MVCWEDYVSHSIGEKQKLRVGELRVGGIDREFYGDYGGVIYVFWVVVVVEICCEKWFGKCYLSVNRFLNYEKKIVGWLKFVKNDVFEKSFENGVKPSLIDREWDFLLGKIVGLNCFCGFCFCGWWFRCFCVFVVVRVILRKWFCGCEKQKLVVVGVYPDPVAEKINEFWKKQCEIFVFHTRG